jgi:hypothetical protein
VTIAEPKGRGCSMWHGIIYKKKINLTIANQNIYI